MRAHSYANGRNALQSFGVALVGVHRGSSSSRVSACPRATALTAHRVAARGSTYSVDRRGGLRRAPRGGYPDSRERWEPPTDTTNLVGYRVYRRLTDSATWNHDQWVGNVTEHRFHGLIIDNYYVGVAAVGGEREREPGGVPDPPTADQKGRSTVQAVRAPRPSGEPDAVPAEPGPPMDAAIG